MGSFDHRDIDVFVGVDMAKQDHYAQAIAGDSTELFDRLVVNDEAAINALIDGAGSGADTRYLVAGIAETEGANSTLWKSDLALLNLAGLEKDKFP